MIKAPKFVSVGGNCQPTVHIRRICGEQEIPFVFDWLECTIDAVSTLIETEFAGFFSPGALQFEWVDGALEVTDQSTGVIARHNFKSDNQKHVEQVALSLRMMGKRFMRLLRGDETVIFVRRWIDKDGERREEAARALHKLLQTYKPGCGFLYLQEHAMRAPVVDGNYVDAFNPRTTNVEDWEGYEALYDSSFARAVRAYESHAAATQPSAVQA
jgi:hypothetical protein